MKFTYKSIESDNLKIFAGDDERISSDVGDKVRRNIFSSNREGFLVYGPYARLEKGRHHIFVYGAALNCSEVDYVDVTRQNGQVVIDRSSIRDAPGNDILAIFTIDLEEPCEDVEFRVF